MQLIVDIKLAAHWHSAAKYQIYEHSICYALVSTCIHVLCASICVDFITV